MTTYLFALTRPAKSKGGDRYECLLVGDDKPWTLYVPQAISRPSGEPIKALNITIEEVKS